MGKDADFEIGNDTDMISMLIVGAAALGGVAIGWFAKHFLSRKHLKQEIKEAIKTLTRDEINQIFSGAEEPKVTVKHVKAKEVTPVQT
ncbi:hypothetical protein BROC_02305 [Candidatus Brocadiaceae bacterium]|nr:hypothetical protein BROC_02305 [Candidatus Brocadiaceae bacterium]